MTILESIILAIVEGLTEFLPVSSTGHMILTEGILGMESTPYLKAFTVMIQFGAILSVVAYYFRRFLPFPMLGMKPDETTSLGGWRLYGLMIVGCIPAAIFGALLSDQIDMLLGNTWVVLGMLFLGGILMVYFDRLFGTREAWCDGAQCLCHRSLPVPSDDPWGFPLDGDDLRGDAAGAES